MNRTINDMPTEILLHISTYIESPGIFAMVCREFYGVIKLSKQRHYCRTADLIINTDNTAICHHIVFLLSNVPNQIIKHILKYAAEKNYYRFIHKYRCIRGGMEKFITRGALLGGNVRLISCPPAWWEIDNNTTNEIIERGGLISLKYIYKIRPKVLNPFLISCSAKYGHLDIIIWARSLNCGWNEYATSAAATGGHLNIIKWLIENGCPYNHYSLWKAIDYEHKHIVEYLLEIGFKTMNREILACRILRSRLQFIKSIEYIVPEIYESHIIEYMVHAMDLDVINYLVGAKV